MILTKIWVRKMLVILMLNDCRFLFENLSQEAYANVNNEVVDENIRYCSNGLNDYCGKNKD